MPLRLISTSVLVAVVVFACMSVVVMVLNVTPSAAGTPLVTVTPSGPYHNGETVSVSVGPNSLFTPEHRIIFIECTDPGGGGSGLPTSVRQCDGNTVQADTVIVARDGSFTEHHFVLYSLPNQAFGELSDAVAVCDTSHPCVLYVGENQEDFTEPKVFSASFTVAATAGSSPTPSGSTPAPAAAPTATQPPVTSVPPAPESSPSPVAVSPAAISPAQATGGTLAFTGMRPIVLWLLWIGSLMFLVGGIGRQLVERSRA
jgi:hypothetical protein